MAYMTLYNDNKHNTEHQQHEQTVIYQMAKSKVKTHQTNGNQLLYY